MKSICLIFLTLCCYIPNLHAETSMINNTPSPSVEHLEKSLCPMVEQIIHDPVSHLWGVGDWISSEPSFEKNIVSFQGAQWVGTHLGTIICAYKSDNPTSFPITIQNSTLAPSPTGPNWGKYEQGRKNCPPYAADNPVDTQDCPFYLPKKDNKPEDIYQQLDFFKNKKTPTP